MGAVAAGSVVVVNEVMGPSLPLTPTQTARLSLLPRPEYIPASQSVPTQGFQNVSRAIVISKS